MTVDDAWIAESVSERSLTSEPVTLDVSLIDAPLIERRTMSAPETVDVLLIVDGTIAPDAALEREAVMDDEEAMPPGAICLRRANEAVTVDVSDSEAEPIGRSLTTDPDTVEDELIEAEIGRSLVTVPVTAEVALIVPEIGRPRPTVALRLDVELIAPEMGRARPTAAVRPEVALIAATTRDLILTSEAETLDVDEIPAGTMFCVVPDTVTSGPTRRDSRESCGASTTGTA